MTVGAPRLSGCWLERRTEEGLGMWSFTSISCSAAYFLDDLSIPLSIFDFTWSVKWKQPWDQLCSNIAHTANFCLINIVWKEYRYYKGAWQYFSCCSACTVNTLFSQDEAEICRNRIWEPFAIRIYGNLPRSCLWPCWMLDIPIQKHFPFFKIELMNWSTLSHLQLLYQKDKGIMSAHTNEPHMEISDSMQSLQWAYQGVNLFQLATGQLNLTQRFLVTLET